MKEIATLLVSAILFGTLLPVALAQEIGEAKIGIIKEKCSFKTKVKIKARVKAKFPQFPEKCPSLEEIEEFKADLLAKFSDCSAFIQTRVIVSLTKCSEIEVEKPVIPFKKLEKLTEKWKEKFEKGAGPEIPVMPEIAPEFTIPATPPLRCPSFIVLKRKGIKIPHKPWIGLGIGQIRKLPGFDYKDLCKDKEKLKAFVKKKIATIKPVICEHLQYVATLCNKRKEISCDKLKKAVENCTKRLKEFKKKLEKKKGKFEYGWEKLERKWKGYRKRMENVSGIFEKGKYGFGPGFEFRPPRFRKKVSAYWMPEKVCERLEQKVEKCEDYVAYCKPNCDILGDVAEKCEKMDADELAENITEHLWKYCQLRKKFVRELPSLKKITKENISEAEVLPLVIVTDDKITVKQKGKIFTLVEKEKLKEIYCKKLCFYRAYARAEFISEIRKLPFVRTVKVDHLVRAMDKGAFKKLPKLPEFPNAEKILGKLELLKQKVEEEVHPIIAEEERKILNVSHKLVRQRKKERKRGPLYGFMHFFGLQSKQEKKDAKFLQKEATKVKSTIAKLEKIKKTQTLAEVKANLHELIEKLKKRAKKIGKRAKRKRAGAGGLLSLLGLA